jgi:hypothetical protein
VWLWGLSELLKASAKSERYCTLKKKSERELGRWVYSLISSHRPIVFRPIVFRPILFWPAAGLSKKQERKSLASPRLAADQPTNHPPPPPSPPSVASAAACVAPPRCLVDWSGSSPIPCWDWEPRVPQSP